MHPPCLLCLRMAPSQDEINHVRFLRKALGKYAVPQPLIDIGPAFAMAANAAFNTTLSPPFSPYASDIAFYLGAFIFEDVGVTAYHVRVKCHCICRLEKL